MKKLLCGRTPSLHLRLAWRGTAVTLLSLFAMALVAAPARGASATGYQAFPMTKEKRDALMPDEIIKRLIEGNRRFIAGEVYTRNVVEAREATALGQNPEAAILGCIDSRAPAELVFETGLGDLFNSRVAGPVVNSDITGSLEFATKVVGAKVVVVMGHTECGAVKGAIDGVELGNLTGLLAKIKPAIAAVGKVEGERNSKNPAFVDAVARQNVRLAMEEIRKTSPILDDLIKSGKIQLIGALYDVRTGKVEILSF